MAQGYTKLIDFKVNDRAIKQATTRLFRSLERIEQKLDAIGGKGGKGFDQVAKGAGRSAAAVEKLNKTTVKSSEVLRGLRGFAKTYAVSLGLLAKGGYDAANALSHLGRAYMPLPAIGKGVLAGFTAQKAALLSMAAAAPLAAKGVAGLAAAYVLFGSKTGTVFKKVLGIFPALHKQLGTFTHKIKMTSKAMEELQRGEGLTGLRTLLSKAVIEQDKLLTSNSGYVQALLKVRALEQDINQELIARQRITDNLIRKEGITAGPGIQGLNTELARQKEILSRMLTTQTGYAEQAGKVKSVEKLITEELKARDKVMNSLLTKQERLAKIGARVKDVAGKGAQFMRPGRGIERRGLAAAGIGGAAGLGMMANTGIGGFTGAGLGKVSGAASWMMGGIPGLHGMGAGLAKATTDITTLSTAAKGLGTIMASHPAILGTALAAWVAFGDKGIRKAIEKMFGLGKQTKKTTATLFALGKTAKLVTTGMSHDFKISADAAKQLGNDADAAFKKLDIAYRKQRLARARYEKGVSLGSGNIQRSGFGAWSAKMDQREEGRRAFAERQVVRASAKRELQRTRGLKIEERINEVLKRRGKIMIANGQVQDIQNKKRIFKGGIGGATSSAMIGGGFPLLFGQGGASAVGGGIGGLVGGALGGGFGFGLSIVGTALGQAYQKNLEFNKSLAVLNVRLKDTGDGSTITAKEIDALAKKMNITKQEAMGVLSAFSEFDSKGVRMSLANMFGQDAGAVDAIAQSRTQAALAEQIFASRKKIGNAKAEELLKQNLIADSATIELALARAIALEEHKKTLEKAKQITFMDRILAAAASDPGAGRLVDPIVFADERVKKLQAEFEKNKAKDAENFVKSLEEIRKLLGLVKDGNNITDKLQEINNLYQQIGQTINDGMVNAIEGAIQGTKTLGEVASSVFRSISRMLLQYGVSTFMGSLFPNSKSWQKFFGARAAGGPVSGNKSYLVGEKGPELFTPTSSGHITPNDELGGSTNIVVNVDASGSDIEGDQEGGRQLGEMLAAAIQSELIKQQRPGGLLTK